MSGSDIDEKRSSTEKVAVLESDAAYAAADAEVAQAQTLVMTPEEQGRILRKIDIAIVPFSTLLYLLSFLDRINIGQARVYGLTTDLRMTPQEYDIALSLFFVGYIIIEIPSNLIIKRAKPHRFICTIMVLWSICMTLMGVVKNGKQLIALRFLLGITEGALFPCLNFLFSTWYTRDHLNKRTSVFFAGATLAGAFGGILAYALEKVPLGMYADERWRSIFIIEGLLTFVFAIPAWWLVAPFPDDDDRILSPEENAKWNYMLRKTQGVTSLPLPNSKTQFYAAFKDWKNYTFAILYACIAMPLYCLALFSPSIIKAFGKTAAQSNLLSVPPYVLGFLLTLANSYFSDKYKRRAPFLLGFMLLTVIGYSILLSPVKFGVKYFAIFLTVAGVSPSIATAITWVGTNFGPIQKRGAVMGLFFTIGNGSGLISSNIYPARDAPRYRKGHSIALSFAILCLILTTVMALWMMRENKRRDENYPSPDELDLDLDGKNLITPEAKAMWKYEHLSDQEILELGDKHPSFRYSW
ncbi:putative MFS nicotinic acid transporter Tna1 [Testicularia cyperi]|uniref:Putative MFS nicotinic acid transporter Tna1 n=1 Tax=Testicularia cyperi TaxID=1882483 RepID=A0A317XJZ8_9BASI|nr:putative MFS nicotinic acid transporter Tna1 [Testicularia cyperi]